MIQESEVEQLVHYVDRHRYQKQGSRELLVNKVSEYVGP